MSLPETIDLGDGIVLERARPEHAAAIARAVGQSLEHLRPYLAWATPDQATEAKQRERLVAHQDEWQRSDHFGFVVRRAADTAVLGSVGLDWTRPERFGGGAIEIGYWIHVNWCNRGLATRASRELTRVAFGVVEVEQVVIVCDTTNVASAAIPRKLGFTLDGIVDAQVEAPSHSGREMVWLRKRTPADTVEFETNFGRTIVRIGDTVHRPVERWTPAVHGLLRHLEAVGFDASPRVLGIDRDRREILSFIPGQSGARSWAHVVPDDGLRAFARFLRRYHDAVRDYLPSTDSVWSRATGAPRPGELVCHGDCGPWNVVWREGNPVGLVDWDHARPASPLHDVAYALEHSVPFRDDTECVRWLRYPSPPDRRQRLEVFADAYGLTSVDGLVESVIDLQRQDIDDVGALARRGLEPQATWVANGYLDELAARVRWSEENRHLFEP